MTTPFDPVQSIFENTIRDFRSNLKNDKLYEEILKTTTIDEVYDATDKLQEEQAKKGQLRHLSKIEPFLEGLRSYASVIEVFMQAKPEIVALIWGPIKLLLQWASTLKQSLDAIINTTADIGALLPEFRTAINLFGHNTHMKDVLALFFKDILEFYLISLKFFSLPRWKYFFASLWPRQGEKIKVVMSHIERHTLLIRNEVRLEHVQAEHDARARALEHFESTEKAIQRQEYQNIKTDMSPRTYEERLDWFHARRCDGTGKWLKRDPTFAKWLDIKDTSMKVLWLQGIPGSGKTFLSSTVVDETRSFSRALYVFLSYTFSNSASALSIIRSLVFQLASNEDCLQTIICQSRHETLKSSINAAKGLLSTLLRAAGPVHIIIDGLDEIDILERGRLLKQLLELSKDCDETKLLVSSRPEADITEILKEKSTIIRVDSRNAGNIQTFVAQHTKKWFREREFFPEAQAEIERLLAPLSSNSKGMFLYAKVILSSIEYLEIDDIRKDMQVPPETLDDAYARVLTRINTSPPGLREKARKLLGWIGSSPRPLTIYEMEQALIINPADIEGKAKVLSRLNVTRICGPIVEVVDDYVQFVHFTVQEYFLSPRIDDSIHAGDATLSLAICSTMYLCQEHHDPDITDEEIAENILSGAYRLHDFAATMWLELTERFISLGRLQALPDELVSLLQTLLCERKNDRYINTEEQDSPGGLETFKNCCPELHSILCEVVRFRRICAKSEYKKTLGPTTWTDFDPLSISKISSRIYEQFEVLLNKANNKNCYRDAIQKYYGNRPFKCGFLNCRFQQHGFETRTLRNSHMRHHDRPWKCDFPGCEFQDGGFLSRKMRDEHLDRFHQEDGTVVVSATETLDPDEIQPLLFDLVKADNVEMVKGLLKEFDVLKESCKEELQKYAARFGSPSMVALLTENSGWNLTGLLACSIESKNQETSRYLLSRYKRNLKPESNNFYYTYASVIHKVLSSDSEEIFEEWSKYVDFEFEFCKLRQSLVSQYVDRAAIAATAGQIYREQLLSMLWRKHVLNNLEPKYARSALVNVASTTCSTELAKVLIDHGVPVDYRRATSYHTPLHNAARQTTAAAAELMKFLLFHGADPEASSRNGTKIIREEKGAKGISKWLGISWDEIVAQAKEKIEKENLADKSSDDVALDRVTGN